MVKKNKKKKKNEIVKVKKKNVRKMKFKEVSLIEIAEEIRVTGGMISVVARRLNVNRMYIYKCLSENPWLQKTLKRIRDDNIDELECKLLEMARDGNLNAMKMYLYAHGGNRGYVPEKFISNLYENKGVNINALTNVDMDKIPYTKLVEWADDIQKGISKTIDVKNKKDK